MKKTTSLSAFFVALFLTACGGSPSTDEGEKLIQFDATKDYPTKEILLDDIAEVSYVPLSSERDEALFKGSLANISSKTVTIHDFQTGDFYLFDRSGAFLASFNHKGQGPEDYNFLITAFVDEGRGELFVIEKNRIQVYDKRGEYLRTLPLLSGAWVYEAADAGDGAIFIVDNHERVTSMYQGMADANAEFYEEPFLKVSKDDGHLISYVKMPKDYSFEVSAPLQVGQMTLKMAGPLQRLVGHRDGFLLTNQETDTIFLYREERLTPVFVHTPPIKGMPEKSYLNGYVEAGDYLFFEKVVLKAEMGRQPPVPSYYYMYDKKDGQFYEQSIGLKDFEGKTIPLAPELVRRSHDARLGALLLTTDELFEANENGKLSGELKTIVDRMDEDSNSLLMLSCFKE